MSKILTVAKKELWTYFTSATAYIFLGAYLLVSLFAFFWVEKFFSRNLADLRPLFDWMPVLMIFLVATLTMKSWSEEHRMGTLEFLLTLPVKTHEYALGKFLACLELVAIGLALTFGLAISVGLLGPIDWGPVFGAYFASLLMAAAYISIGLFVSSRSNSQIISLIVTSIVCGSFYLIGSEALVGFFGNKGSEILRLIGSGSRFNSISRGVLDFRDIYYYLSITALFLSLSVFYLERLKWSKGPAVDSNHSLKLATTVLLGINLLVANIWLNKVDALRVDMTQHRIYSISDATKDVLHQLQEPLTIRGYFSAKTHPLLAPLVPTVRDFLKEYQLASQTKVKTEFLDPVEDENVEAEINRKYNIKPVPFQVADRHSAAMVSSYFNIVIEYGNQHEVLGFEELIEVKHDGVGEINVQLRNLEYDITSRVKKVLQSFQGTDNLFASLDKPVKFVGYVSEASLPEKLQPLVKDIKLSLEKYKQDAGGKLEIEFLDPSADQELANTIATKYGFKPQALSIFAQESFYFYLTLQHETKVYPLGIPEDLSVAHFNTNMDATLKRLAPGFLRTAGLYTPPSAPSNPMMAQFGGAQESKQYQAVRQKLSQNYNVETLNLDTGVIPGNIDLVVVVAPKDLNEKQVFALDQFLMAGGSVILATSPVSVDLSREGFDLKEQQSGLESWLSHFGIEIPKELVLDTRNSGFPEMRRRVIQGITINEPTIVSYPFFVDIRQDGLDDKNAIASGLGQITLAWPSPIVLDAEKNKGRQVVALAKSSKNSWRTSEMNIESNRALYPEIGFKEGEKKESSTLAALVEGEFTSYFAGKTSPLLVQTDKDASKAKDKIINPADDGEEEGDNKKKDTGVVTGVIEKSPSVARIILVASNEFVADEILKISGMINGTQYLNPLQLLENAADWSTEDRSLLSIRSRGHFARTLVPLTEGQKTFWEGLNYVLAVLGLLGVYLVYRIVRNRSTRRFKELNLA